MITIFGLALAFLNQTPLFDMLFNDQINPVFWDSSTVDEEIKTFQRWTYAVLGATVAGWGVFMAFIAQYPFKAREKWSWNCLTSGLLVWFITDEIVSLYYQVYFNVLFNLVILLLVGLPLVITREYFNKAAQGDKP
jgi:hypothetical protein